MLVLQKCSGFSCALIFAFQRNVGIKEVFFLSRMRKLQASFCLWHCSCAPAPSAATFPALLPVSSPFMDSLGEHRAACARAQQLAVDTTLVSPLSGSGQPCSWGGRVQGAALALARRRKKRTYPELLRSERCRLVVLAVEVGGRWSDEAASFVHALAPAKAREVPVRLRSSLVAALVARWSALLSHAAMLAFAAPSGRGLSHADGALPPLGELLADAGEAPLAACRLAALRTAGGPRGTNGLCASRARRVFGGTNQGDGETARKEKKTGTEERHVLQAICAACCACYGRQSMLQGLLGVPGANECSRLSGCCTPSL